MYNKYKYMAIPDFDIRQPCKKAVPYTVTPIGGHNALLAWRKEQALLAEARDAYLKPIRQATRDRVVAMVANQNAEIKADAISLAERKMFAAVNDLPQEVKRGLEQSERGELKYLGSFAQYAKPTISERVKEALKALWDATGFYK